MPALPPRDLGRLMERASGRGHTGSRNRALVAVFAGAGLGVAEVLAMTAADVDPRRGIVRVAGPRGRLVPVDPAVMSILVAWVAERRALGLPPGGRLFCTRDGLALEASYVRRLLSRLGREAGIGGAVNARVLRESYAATRIAAGASAEELRAELGHATIASTQRFVRQLGGAPAPAHGLPPDVVDALLEAAHCGLTVVRAQRDSDGAIRDFVVEYVNPAGAEILGGSAAWLPGASVRESFPDAPDDGTYARWTALIEQRRSGAADPGGRAEGGARSGRIRRVALGDRIVMSLEGRGERSLALIGSGAPGPAHSRRAS